MLTPLESLDVEEVPDVASRAVRRFRLHVVLFTVGCVLTAAAVGGVVVRWVTKDQIQTQATGWTPAQTAVLNDLVDICATPTFDLGNLQVGVLDATTIDGGGTALHLVVNGPISEQRDDSGGGSSVRTTSFTIADASGVWQVEAQPGATWGEV